MKLTELQQQVVHARMSLIVGAENYDRLFLGAEFSEVVGRVEARQARRSPTDREITRSLTVDCMFHHIRWTNSVTEQPSVLLPSQGQALAGENVALKHESESPQIPRA
jgi:hypothetical protein